MNIFIDKFAQIPDYSQIYLCRVKKYNTFIELLSCSSKLFFKSFIINFYVYQSYFKKSTLPLQSVGQVFCFSDSLNPVNPCVDMYPRKILFYVQKEAKRGLLL